MVNERQQRAQPPLAGVEQRADVRRDAAAVGRQQRLRVAVHDRHRNFHPPCRRGHRRQHLATRQRHIAGYEHRQVVRRLLQRRLQTGQRAALGRRSVASCQGAPGVVGSC